MTTASSHRASSPMSMHMVPPRTSTPLLRMLPRSSSLVTLLSMAYTTNEPPSPAARRPDSRSSTSPLLTPRSMPLGPTLTSRGSLGRAALPDTLPGLAPTPSIARTSSSTTSGGSGASNSRTSPTTVPAPILAATATSVRVPFLIVRLLMTLRSF